MHRAEQFETSLTPKPKFVLLQYTFLPTGAWGRQMDVVGMSDKLLGTRSKVIGTTVSKSLG